MGGSLTSPNKIKDVYKKLVFNENNQLKTDNGTANVVITIDADNNTISNLEVDNLKSGVLDTDLSSVAVDDTTLASAKAIKTYVDSQVTAQDLDFQADTGGALSIDLDSESLTISGGTGVSTVGSGNTITINSVDSEIVHDNLSGYSADKHVAHSSVTLTAGTGLTGGGDITTSRQFAVDTSVIATKTYVDTQVSTVNTLEELTDTNITSPATDSLLQYNGSQWIDVTEISGGTFI